MKTISDVIAELIKAANSPEIVTGAERLRLLNRAYVTIIEGSEALGELVEKANLDITLDIATSSRAGSDLTDDEAKALFLEAASLIRKIKVAVDQKRRRSSAVDRTEP